MATLTGSVGVTAETAIGVLGLLLLAATFASRVADRVGVPALLAFLGIGMLAGSEGIGGVHFDSPEVAQSLGTVSLAIILYAGGLETRWADVRPVIAPGTVLSTVGVLLTTIALAVFAKLMLGTYAQIDVGPAGLSWLEAGLIAAVVSSTDAAAVFSVYRTSPVQPRKSLRSLLELESGSNDPMAVLLTLTCLQVMTGEAEFNSALAGALAAAVGVGAGVGLTAGWIGASLADSIRFGTDELKAMWVFGVGGVAFGLADTLGGNGFLAVYVAGVAVGNRLKTGRDHVLGFHGGLSWLMQIIMFVALGLLVFPSQLPAVAIPALALAAFLMIVARPLAVAVCLLPFRARGREIAYVSWVGLRGSVPIILATFPLTFGVERADQLFNVVFFVVLTSVLVQGLTLVPMTRILGVDAEEEKSA